MATPTFIDPTQSPDLTPPAAPVMPQELVDRYKLASVGTPAPAAKPKPQAAPSQDDVLAQVFMQLADRAQWTQALGPNGEVLIQKAPQTVAHVGELPHDVQDLFRTLYPDKWAAGMRPVGWTSMEGMSPQEMALLAHLKELRKRAK